MPRVLKGAIPKTALESLSSANRQAIIRAGLILNDLKMLNRLIVGFGDHSENEIIANIQMGFRISLIRLLIGKVFELYEVSKTNRLFKDFLDGDPDITEDWQKIEEKCSSGGAYVRIRNTMAFHYPKDRAIGNVLPSEYPEHSFLYSGELNGNVFAQFAEDFVTTKLMEILGIEGDEATERLVSFVLDAVIDSGVAIRVVVRFMRFLVEHEMGSIPSTWEDVPIQPELSEVSFAPFLANNGIV